jgi:hypothetical protein
MESPMSQRESLHILFASAIAAGCTEKEALDLLDDLGFKDFAQELRSNYPIRDEVVGPALHLTNEEALEALKRSDAKWARSLANQI